jgi:putative salt-induced outer membrane protein YdiY
MAGPAVGTFLIRTEMIRLSAELGPVYVFEKIDDLKEDYLSVRVAQEFSYAFEQFGKLTQMVEYIARADDDENYQINAEVGLESALSERLALGVTLRSRYDNSVGGDTEKNDVTLVSSLKLTL